MPKISIIIPVYNVEKYIEKCIDSVLAQTFTDFECILINDGSPDNSPAICDEYAKKDKRIKVIHKKNGGVSSARNAGLDIAQGEWVGFIDSDDWVDEKFLEFLYGNAVKHNVDVSICGINKFCDGVVRRLDKYTSDITLTSKESLLFMCDSDFAFGGYSVNKLSKKQVIEKNNLRYDETMSYMEDYIFLYNILKAADSVYYDPQPYYFYRVVNTSVTRQFGFTPGVIKAVTAWDKLYENETDFEIRQKILLDKLHFICSVGINCIRENKKDEAFRTNMHNLKRHIFSRDVLSITFRCKIFAVVYLPFTALSYIRIKKQCARLLEKRNG